MSERGDTPGKPTRFDHFVEAAHGQVSRGRFFIFCVTLVVIWLFSYPLFDDPKGWQVAIHTVASVITLLLVALLENAGRRDAEAAQEKLSTIAAALADLMDSSASNDPELAERAAELRKAVDLEERSGTG